MKCIVLAAGYATRLYPLTENFPKPLLKVGEKTILDWLLDDINTSGEVDEYIVISNHKYAHHFDEWAKTKTYKITVLDDGTETNETRLGAVKDIEFAIEKLSLSGDMLVIAGDNVLDFSLTKFVSYCKEKGTSCVMRYFEPDKKRLLKSGVLTLKDDLVVSMTEKSPEPATNWCCPPFYYYTASAAAAVKEAIEDGCGTDAPGSFIAWLCEKEPVHALEMPGRRYDVGNIENYTQICENYKGITVC